MPFYLHAKSSPLPASDPNMREFATRELAVAALTESGSRTLTITYIATERERDRWTDRECERFNDSTYIQVPWHHTQWQFASTNLPWNTAESSAHHYAHLSLTDPGMIAYTPSDDYGMRDRQIRITPGKYLARFAPDFARMHAEWIASCNADKYQLKLARTPDEIETVYTRGPGSCMRGDDHSFASHIHPCRVYGDSDLAVAYYGDITNVSARAIVWPDKMIHSRIYGAQETLQKLLTLAGYKSGNLDGARIHAVRSRGVYVMPYVDWVECASLSSGNTNLLSGKSTYFVLHASHRTNHSGRCYDTGSTNGLTDSNISAQQECRDCGNEYDPDDEGGDGYCGDCYERTVCAECCNRFDTDDCTLATNGEYYCESCYDDLLTTCDHCDEPFREVDYSSTVRSQRRRYVTNMTGSMRDIHQQVINHYCADCYLAIRHCESHSTYYHTDSLTESGDRSTNTCDCGAAWPTASNLLTAFAEVQWDNRPRRMQYVTPIGDENPTVLHYVIYTNHDHTFDVDMISKSTPDSPTPWYRSSRVNPMLPCVARGTYTLTDSPVALTQPEAN